MAWETESAVARSAPVQAASMQVVVEEMNAEDVQRQSRSVAEVHEPRFAFAMHELAQSVGQGQLHTRGLGRRGPTRVGARLARGEGRGSGRGGGGEEDGGGGEVHCEV